MPVLRARGAGRLDLGPYGRARRPVHSTMCRRASGPISFRSISTGIETDYMSMIHGIPSSEEVGLKDDYNGPDLLYAGRESAAGPRGRGCATCGSRRLFPSGSSAAGGAGKYLADLIVEGEAEIGHSLRSTRGASGRGSPRKYLDAEERGGLRHVFIPAPSRRGAPGLPAPAPHRPPMTGRRRWAPSLRQVHGWEGPLLRGRWMRRRASTLTHGFAPAWGVVAVCRGRGAGDQGRGGG